MDPRFLLDDAERWLINGELARAAAAVRDYWAWRRAGWAEPMGGDAEARRLGVRVRCTWRLRAELGPVPISECLQEWLLFRGSRLLPDAQPGHAKEVHDGGD